MPVITRPPGTESAPDAHRRGRPTGTTVVSLLLLAVACLPAVGIAVVMVADRAVTDESVVSPDRATGLVVPFTVLTMNLQVLVSVFVAVRATAAARDLRQRAPSRSSSRTPPPPHRVMTALATLSLSVLVLVSVPLVVVAAGALVARVPAGDLALPLLRGVVEALVLAVVLGPVSLLIAAVVPRRSAGVVAVIAVLTVLGGLQVASAGLTTTLGASAAWFGLLSPYSLVDGAVGAVLGGDAATPVPGAPGGVVFVALTVALVVGCWLALRARYARVAALA